MKTDKSVIADLPDKTEIKAYCPLSRKQAALYEQTVTDLAEALQDSRRDPAQGRRAGDADAAEADLQPPVTMAQRQRLGRGGQRQLARLRDIASVVAARQEKMLVFTQFREMTTPLATFLGGVFGRPGLILHGNTAVKDRKDLVRTFQEDEAVPFFVLSLKAGGSGLNLTAASHVVHFDRWWNPAVENQATDRAFRIGQKRNVMVHKFVCQGTVEEKIEALIESKKSPSEDVLAGSGEISLTEMKDDDLLRLVALDLKAAMKD